MPSPRIRIPRARRIAAATGVTAALLLAGPTAVAHAAAPAPEASVTVSRASDTPGRADVSITPQPETAAYQSTTSTPDGDQQTNLVLFLGGALVAAAAAAGVGLSVMRRNDDGTA
ncbi:hypothetical protein [Yinghuangia seranimata]|uniref:hypothetical protein n=1 Tax=Yinghuangia seranimata TaxID=408067 RepID=UPI00248C86E4|nr:hypothetical protein [Yinghuangia seranimata]MDI2126432.1 hypothetical protein [Yinghuangia seranimata]